MTPAQRPLRRAILLFGVALGSAAPHLAAALPDVGESPANARVEDVDGKALWLSELKGRVAIVVYEDKDSAELNKALKDDLAKLLKDDTVKGAVVVAPVADVSDYNSWPQKGFAKDAIRAESKKSKTTIWCDWDGAFRKALDLKKGTSSVLVIDREGTLRFAGEGALSQSERASFEKVVRQLSPKKK